MARYQSDALVLGSLNYSETSRIVHLLCKDEGKISLLAKGVRSAKGAGNAALQPFNAVSITYYLKDDATSFGTLGATDLIRSWPGLHQDLLAYGIACYWFEILEVAAQARLEATALYNLTFSFLSAVSKSETPTDQWLQPFLPLLQLLGFGLSTPLCAGCGAENVQWFEDHVGQFYCDNCSQGLRLVTFPSEVFTAVQQVFGLSQNESGSPLKALILFHRYICRHLDHPLRSFGFLENVLPR